MLEAARDTLQLISHSKEKERRKKTKKSAQTFRRRSRLSRGRFRQQTSPSGRVRGFRGEALNQSRSDSGVYTGLTMRHQCGLYEKYAMPGVKCRTDA